MHLFKLDDFVLHSGRKSHWKIDCDALTDKDIECLAKMIDSLTIPFSTVEGIPRGGLRIAKALEQYTTKEPGVHTHLIVDDVMTTGNSLMKAKLRYWESNPNVLVIGAVIFARGPRLPWVSALFHVASQLWDRV